jgi:hypothetical protein
MYLTVMHYARRRHEPGRSDKQWKLFIARLQSANCKVHVSGKCQVRVVETCLERISLLLS